MKNYHPPGLTGDLMNGRIDMMCRGTLMNAARLAAHDFTYPLDSGSRSVRIFFVSHIYAGVHIS
jgi:hypothetical protein